MNDERRRQKQDIEKRVNEARSTVQQLITDIEDLKEQEETALSSLPESFQNSERGETMQQTVDYLSEASSNLDEAESSIGSAVENLENIE